MKYAIAMLSFMWIMIASFIAGGACVLIARRCDLIVALWLFSVVVLGAIIHIGAHAKCKKQNTSDSKTSDGDIDDENDEFGARGLE